MYNTLLKCNNHAVGKKNSTSNFQKEKVVGTKKRQI